MPRLYFSTFSAVIAVNATNAKWREPGRIIHQMKEQMRAKPTVRIIQSNCLF
ncbi:hypothetical protein PF010_g25393 [Phytophthora fragariae]|uniref:Uncharacterized protein n=1 Tax=Phytophthora fragariae TaxID=53985 RepID=A0A6A3WZF0_9STRA|nr:hypothetical protein PF003_g18536 [Phytophthora fragariae]KAE8979817.1 hypothetical protein PF011_g22689 [Phytophthora fragariae]KAE9072664.1 hypothetical protein PF010_g25393 [Phytophthora fragariae]KAE9074384.1 hypothetical protein PF007_g25431 [Phytophthora fragariae]KAE9092410.1 hypothetical protein PF006_g24709 [Phytophthora fragariae]